MDVADAVRTYYRALDQHDYESLATVLAPDFVQRRPDRSFDGRAAFVRFMREERPMKETTHEILTLYPKGAGVAARGRLCDADGEPVFEFVDVFSFDDEGTITALQTYTA